MGEAANRTTDDLLAFVDTLEPAEALTGVLHVARYIEKIAETHLVGAGPFVGIVGLSSAVIQGLVEQITTKPGGLAAAEVTMDDSVVGQINRSVTATIERRQG